MDHNKNFKTYDYTSIVVSKEFESIYIDTYESFGWELTTSELSMQNTSMTKNIKLSFKRDRKINKKNDLNKLQKETEVCFSNIKKYENQKTSIATIKALSIGFLAIVFIALSVFIITDYIKISIVFSILFGIIGILLCIPPYFVYKKNTIRSTEKLDPLIDKEYDKISDICLNAHNLVVNNECR